MDNTISNIYPGQAGLFLCTRGTADIMVNNTVLHICRGFLCIVSPINIICCIHQSEDYKSVEILDELNVFYPVVRSIVETIVWLKLRENPSTQLSEEETNFFEERTILIENKIKMRDSSRHKYEQTVLTRMVELLKQETLLEATHIFLRNSQVVAKSISKSETFVYNFILSLHNNFKKERSVSFYANEAHLSTGYFTSVIRENTGRTPSEWIADITTTQAKLLLSKSNMSIKEIASELGFPEQFTFRKYFKLHTGLAPKAYRQAVK